MKKVLSTSALVLLVFSSLAFVQRTQIRIRVQAVNLLVTVTDKKDRFVTDLTKDRFQVYEDGVLQQIDRFSHETDLPLRIALLMDTSGSVRLKLGFEKKAATGFLYSIMRPRDRALLAEFDTGVTLLHDFTSSPRAIAREINSLQSGGGTALLDALYQVTQEKMGGGSDRKTIVVLSDGREVSSAHSVEQTLFVIHSSGVRLYAIGTTRFGANQDHKGENLLKKLSENTGGRLFLPYSSDQLMQAFDLINEELRSQYSITYTPKNQSRKGGYRKIKVKLVKGKGLTVRYRKGYYLPSRSKTI